MVSFGGGGGSVLGTLGTLLIGFMASTFWQNESFERLYKMGTWRLLTRGSSTETPPPPPPPPPPVTLYSPVVVDAAEISPNDLHQGTWIVLM